MDRRNFTVGVAAACTLGLVMPGAHAATYPEKPVKLVTPYPSGGQLATLAVALSRKLTASMGQPVVLDIRPGAGGTIAGGIVARAPKDGYTLLLATSGMLGIAKYIYKDLPYDPVTDFTPAAYLGAVPVGVFASQQSGIDSLPKLLTVARANPGKVNFGTPGVGSASHLAGELLNIRAGINLIHVPYASTTTQMTDLIGGQTQLTIASVPNGLSFAKDGRVKFIAIASKSRSKLYPDVPALAEIAPGFDAPAWLAVVAPSGTPKAIIDRIDDAVRQLHSDPEFMQLIELQQLDLIPLSAAALGEKMRGEMKLWEEAVRAAGIRPAVPK